MSQRGSIIDVAGVPDTSLKLVTIENLKMNKCKIMSTTTRLVKEFFGGIFSGGNFAGAIFQGAVFCREHFREVFFGVGFFRTPLFIYLHVHTKKHSSRKFFSFLKKFNL